MRNVYSYKKKSEYDASSSFLADSDARSSLRKEMATGVRLFRHSAWNIRVIWITYSYRAIWPSLKIVIICDVDSNCS